MKNYIASFIKKYRQLMIIIKLLNFKLLHLLEM